MLPHEAFFNKVAYGTAIVHIPVKLLTIMIILCFTPKSMRGLSMFFLNHMAWNFASNLLFTFFHIYPAFPAECFRVDGLLGLNTNEDIGHAVFYAEMFCVILCGIGITITFPYRYLVFVYPHRRFNPAWIVGSGIVLQICMGSFFGVAYLQWIVAYDDYPWQEQLPDRRSLVCFKPSGWGKAITIWTLFIFIVLMILTIIGFSILLLRSIQKQRGKMRQKLLDEHRRILWTLILLSSIPVVFGGIPLLLTMIATFWPHLPYSLEIAAVCIVLTANHGSVYALALIVAIRPYKRAVRKMLWGKEKVPKKVGDVRIATLLSASQINYQNK
uniref:G protein-coupled receptor n=1 Tax=Steinernema glaseri TaxID=37863 RepID=A0A1I7YAN9_9BILA